MKLKEILLAIDNGDLDEDMGILFRAVRDRHTALVLSRFTNDKFETNKAVDLTLNH